jgi:hypothetical protein
VKAPGNCDGSIQNEPHSRSAVLHHAIAKFPPPSRAARFFLPP